jgi:hypothetical protein
MTDVLEADDGHRVAEHFLQYVVVDAQGPFPVSIRGNRYWVAVVDVCTGLKMSFPAPTLAMAVPMLDHVLTRECNRVGQDVQAMFRSVRRMRPLRGAASTGDAVADAELAAEASILGEHLKVFTVAGLAGQYVDVTDGFVLEPRPTTVGVVRSYNAASSSSSAMYHMSSSSSPSSENEKYSAGAPSRKNTPWRS